MKISNLEKTFGGFSLRIGGIHLTPGRIYGLIGPNGCGKTTAIRLMAGLLEPDAGEIDREGLTRRDITMIPRKPYFLQASVYRNLTYPLTLRGMKPDRELLEHYLEMAGLKDRHKQYALNLSAGEQQKLSIIRAVAFSPKLILMDEAFSNLDMESTVLFERLILERQAKEPATYMISSHQLSHIQRLCGHVFFMRSGRIEAEGPACEILLRPQNPRLQKYLRYASLNESEAGYGIPEG